MQEIFLPERMKKHSKYQKNDVLYHDTQLFLVNPLCNEAGYVYSNVQMDFFYFFTKSVYRRKI